MCLGCLGDSRVRKRERHCVMCTRINDRGVKPLAHRPVVSYPSKWICARDAGAFRRWRISVSRAWHLLPIWRAKIRWGLHQTQERKNSILTVFRIQTLCSPCGTSSLVYPFHSCPFSRRFHLVCFFEVIRKKEIVRTQSRPLFTQPAYMLLTSSLPPSLPPPSRIFLTHSVSLSSYFVKIQYIRPVT